MSRTGSHAASTPSLSHAVRRGGSGRGAVAVAVAVAVILLSASAFRVPFRSDGADGKNPKGDAQDARRFSTRQGCLVEKSRRRSGPGVPQARRARRQGRAFFGPRFFARAKKGGSLLRSRGESFALKLSLLALPLDCLIYRLWVIALAQMPRSFAFGEQGKPQQ